MKHEYSSDELRELKSIYDESGEAGLSRDEMRALRKAGLLPAFDKHSPRKTTQKPTTTGKKKETMTTTSKITADNVTETKLTPSDVTTGTITVKPQATADPRAIIANALVGIFDAVSALQRTAFQANDKVVYGFATKLLTGELMDIKANYSKDAK